MSPGTLFPDAEPGKHRVQDVLHPDMPGDAPQRPERQAQILPPQLRQIGQFRRVQMRSGIRCKVTSTVSDAQWPPDLQTVFFRIFQETLTNVIRHAKAKQVDVRLQEQNGSLVMAVRDNGRGISPEELASTRSLGLVGMRERAMLIGGEVTLTGAPGKGTTVTLRVPLPKGAEP